MPPSNPELILTRTAVGNISANRAVTHADTTPDTAGVKVLGVAASDAVIGEPYGVTVTGTAIIEAGAAVSVGDDIITDNQGRAIPATGTAGERPFGDALTGATAAGKLFEILLKH